MAPQAFPPSLTSRSIFGNTGNQDEKPLLRLKEAGHLARMNEDRCCKRIFLAKPMGNRPRGRPPLRWIDYAEKDPNILKVKNWKTDAKNRDAWRRPGSTQGHQKEKDVVKGIFHVRRVN
ncbi:hypothetical protein TNCV_3058161 [Trichonephila clavipes]|nr:hypothetical protein TNCV_3058161 [Trichonephila clavipes]